MNTPVKFSTAKLLQEKGLKIKSQKAYMYRHIEHTFDSYKGILVEAPLKCDIPAPTIADVVMWIYDNYKIWISVDVDISGFYGHYKIKPIGTLSSNLKQGWVNSETNPFNSPEEAYEAAIEYVLTKDF